MPIHKQINSSTHFEHNRFPSDRCYPYTSVAQWSKTLLNLCSLGAVDSDQNDWGSNLSLEFQKLFFANNLLIQLIIA